MCRSGAIITDKAGKVCITFTATQKQWSLPSCRFCTRDISSVNNARRIHLHMTGKRGSAPATWYEKYNETRFYSFQVDAHGMSNLKHMQHVSAVMWVSIETLSKMYRNYPDGISKDLSEYIEKSLETKESREKKFASLLKDNEKYQEECRKFLGELIMADANRLIKQCSQ